MNWDFKHHPERHYQWESYYSPQNTEMGDLYTWCQETFGRPGNGRWDNRGGWIRFRDAQDMTLFLLRWPR